MAKTKGVSKSQTIRDHLKANPDAKAKEVVKALAGAGVKVNEGLVYAVKGAMKEKKRRKAKLVKAARAAASVGQERGNGFANSDAISLIRDVKALAQRAGGYESLKGLVEAL